MDIHLILATYDHGVFEFDTEEGGMRSVYASHTPLTNTSILTTTQATMMAAVDSKLPTLSTTHA